MIPEMTSFLKWLPTLTGFGIVSQIEFVEDYMANLEISDFKIKNKSAAHWRDFLMFMTAVMKCGGWSWMRCPDSLEFIVPV